MAKHCLFLLTALQATVTSQAAICGGSLFDSCNDQVNTCTDDGLCVIDTINGNCCSLSKPYGWNSCHSEENGDVCTTPEPTPRPTNTKPPTPEPTEPPTSSNAPTETCYNIEIGLIFDEYPGETRWEITQGRRNSIENENANVLKRSPYYDPYKGFVEASETHIICLPKGRYTYTIMDRNMDGMCCGSGEGRYVVTYQESGEIITYGAEFEQFETVTFQIPFATPLLVDADGDGVEDRTKNVIPPMILTEDGFPPAVCENEFGLHLQTDDYGVETTWELRERSSTDYIEDGQVVVSGGPYTSDFTYDLSYCVRPGQYTFVFYDWQCDGLIGNTLTGDYTLKVNGVEKHTGGSYRDNYWEEVELDFVQGMGMETRAAVPLRSNANSGSISGEISDEISVEISGARTSSACLFGITAMMISAMLLGCN